MNQAEERASGRGVGFFTHYVLINIVMSAIVLAVLLAALKVVKEARRHRPHVMWGCFETVAAPSNAAASREDPPCP